jgi:hypothetical protein
LIAVLKRKQRFMGLTLSFGVFVTEAGVIMRPLRNYVLVHSLSLIQFGISD